MSIMGVLTRNEFLKMRKRRAFWVTLALFSAIALLGLGEDFVDALREGTDAYAFPNLWGEVLGEPTQIVAIFGTVALLLLISSEFAWRTARQNVIDGLTREQWYWGKAITVLLVATAFLGLYLVIGGGFGIAATDFGGPEPIMHGYQARALGAVVLSVAGYGALALLIATIVRSTGGAMAIWFFYVAFGESLIRNGIARVWEGSAPYLAYAPVAVFDALRDYLMFDPAALARVAERMQEAGRPAPEPGDPGTLALVAGGWIVLLVLGGFLAFRRRDL
ncbi:MAG TPA: ABC transporter permease [Longimicrobiales bacterium]|nr:ABC transporter permease [Longimicrobiales bacterium]